MMMEFRLGRETAWAQQRGGGDKPMVCGCSIGVGSFYRAGGVAVKAGNGRYQCLSLKAPVTEVKRGESDGGRLMRG
jgi:predicted metal-dependent phosphoesterase TrpH